MLAGLVVRPVLHGCDDTARADIHNRTLQDHEDSAPITADDIASWNLSPNEANQRRFIAELDGAAVGTSANYTGPARTGGVGILLGPNVVPEHRRSGIGTALARAALDDLRDRGACNVEAEVADRPGNDAFLHSLGFLPNRAASTMRCLLDVLPPVNGEPEPVAIGPLDRSAGGIAAYVALHNTCFKDYPGHEVVTPDVIRYWMESIASAGTVVHVLVAARAGEQVGLISASYNPRSFDASRPKRGQLYGLAVSVPLRGRGIGTALLMHAMRWLQDAGIDEAELSVDDFNDTGARRLYEQLGFAVAGREITYSLNLTRA